MLHTLFIVDKMLTFKDPRWYFSVNPASFLHWLSYNWMETWRISMFQQHFILSTRVCFLLEVTDETSIVNNSLDNRSNWYQTLSHSALCQLWCHSLSLFLLQMRSCSWTAVRSVLLTSPPTSGSASPFFQVTFLFSLTDCLSDMFLRPIFVEVLHPKRPHKSVGLIL